MPNTSCGATRAAPLRQKCEGAIMTHASINPTGSKPRWQRHKSRWHFVANGKVVAQLVRNEGGWLSWIDRADNNGWSCVDFLTLVHAKACMMQWWASRTTNRAFDVYSRPRNPEICERDSAF